jgi:NAD(P)-dependent dehydrogenase (short-subunit alcohol dehydrogenase family)
MSAEQKVAVITGASQGIGAELVRAFLRRGYRVVANSRSIRSEDSSEVLAVAAVGESQERRVKSLEPEFGMPTQSRGHGTRRSIRWSGDARGGRSGAVPGVGWVCDGGDIARGLAGRIRGIGEVTIYRVGD